MQDTQKQAFKPVLATSQIITGHKEKAGGPSAGGDLFYRLLRFVFLGQSGCTFNATFHPAAKCRVFFTLFKCYPMKKELLQKQVNIVSLRIKLKILSLLLNTLRD